MTSESSARSGNLYNDIATGDRLRSLVAKGDIPPGVVCTDSIVDIDPEDLRDYNQVHLFAGVGGWSQALKLAGVDAAVKLWSMSLPCQPFSWMGDRKGFADERHLWPAALRLIEVCRPPIIFGEQVAAAAQWGWLDDVFDDLERIGYACAAADLPACCVGAPYIRQRLWWFAHADGVGYAEPPLPRSAEDQGGDGEAETYFAGSLHGLPCPKLWSEGVHQSPVPIALDGVPGDLERITKGLGNAIVPQLAALFIQESLACLS